MQGHSPGVGSVLQDIVRRQHVRDARACHGVHGCPEDAEVVAHRGGAVAGAGPADAPLAQEDLRPRRAGGWGGSRGWRQGLRHVDMGVGEAAGGVVVEEGAEGTAIREGHREVVHGDAVAGAHRLGPAQQRGLNPAGEARLGSREGRRVAVGRSISRTVRRQAPAAEGRRLRGCRGRDGVGRLRELRL